MKRASSWLVAGALALVAGAVWYVARPATPPSHPFIPFATPPPETGPAPLQMLPALSALAPRTASDAPLAAEGLSDSERGRLEALSGAIAEEPPELEAALEPLHRWAETDPIAAARWVLKHLLGPVRKRALEEVFGVWADRSPGEALAWLDRQKDAESLRPAHVVVLEALARTEPAAAAEWMRTAGHRAPPEAYEILFSTWGASDPLAAARWAQAMLPPERLAGMLPELLVQLPDPQAAALLLQGAAGETADAALSEAARRAVRSSPELAASLAARIAGSEERSRTQSDILSVWQRRDPESATRYAEQEHVAVPPAGGSVDRSRPPAPAPAARSLPAESGVLPLRAVGSGQ